MSAECDEYFENCPTCDRARREDEAAQGLRCSSCLESFDKRYPFRSDTSPSLCRSCERNLNAPVTGLGARYGNQQSRVDADHPRGTW